ncbi:MAG: holo-ACP synthase [Symploca sp. SIO2E9]|nr:holo-ACP synthase [Symploca sp. SIO2E9]
MLPELESTAEVKGIGIDLIPISRIARLIDRYDHQTLNLLFTPSEIDLCQSASYPHQSYAVCFAAKEAVGKALGTGLADIGWNEIEAKIIQGRLTIKLYGEASVQAKKRGLRAWLATWCHWDQQVLVHVIAH